MRKKLHRSLSCLGLILSFFTIVSAQSEYRRTQEPRFSPDGKLIVFSATVSKERTDLSKGIAVMNADGTNVRTITPNVSNVFDMSPSLSPDGSKVVFIRQNINKQDVYTINLDGSGLKQLTSSTENEINPEFTSDGKSVLFVRPASNGLIGFGLYNNGALILLNLETGTEQTVLGKEFQVIQGFSAPRGLFLVLVGKLDENLKPLSIKENGTMIALATPDGMINPRGAIALPAEAKFVSRMRVSFNAGLTILAMGEAGFAKYFSYLITPKGAEKLPDPSGLDYHLSPDAAKLITWGDGSSINVKGLKEERGITIGNKK